MPFEGEKFVKITAVKLKVKFIINLLKRWYLLIQFLFLRMYHMHSIDAACCLQQMLQVVRSDGCALQKRLN